MRAGPLNTILTLYRPVVGDGLRAAATVGWEEAGRVRAEKVRSAARSAPENSEQWADYSPVYRVRLTSRPPLDGWRLRDRDDAAGRLYVISNTIADRSKGMLTLQCDRVNL